PVCHPQTIESARETEEISEVIAFGRAVMSRLGVRAEPSRILIVDTGLAREAFDSGVLTPYIGISPEIIRSPLRRTDGGEWECTFQSRGSFHLAAGGGNPEAFETGRHPRCALPVSSSSAPLSDGSIFAIPKKDGATQLYDYAHGTLVSQIAIGGPDLEDRFDGLANIISINFFRATRATGDPRRSVQVDDGDFIDALEFAGDESLKYEVVNFSMKTNAGESFANAFNEFISNSDGPLLVASAGNGSEDLDEVTTRHFPAGLERNSHLLVVAGGERNGGSWRIWPKSARSIDKVDIAAPAVGVRSRNEEGDLVCLTGTSAAAPQVSFVAGVLFALGEVEVNDVRRRILDTADTVSGLMDFVQGGRFLNVARALDVFRDVVVMRPVNGSERAVMKGRVVADDGLFEVCAKDGLFNEKRFGLTNLVRWRLGGSGAEFVRSIEGLRSKFEPCAAVPRGEFGFRRVGSDEVESVAMGLVEEIFFSPFRSPEVEWAVARSQ
ncbi:MAG: S8 family serine peptidase, partial [Planctomycetales bacterium]|nr:S8 family serine peptidase [Planctomycetales bacterium]